jgi:hypothetical protein
MTLVEVLLAVVILGTSAMVLMTAASRCLAVIRIARNYHTARNIFDLGELEYPVIHSEKEHEIYNLNLDPVDYGNGFSFTRQAEEKSSDPEGFQAGLYVVRTRVAWADRGNQVAEETLSYLYTTNAIR